MVEDTKILEFLGDNGIVLDLSQDSLTWYWAMEMEGFSLKVKTNNLPKARQLVQLSNGNGFGLKVQELSSNMQSYLRVIANGKDIRNGRDDKSIPIPDPPKILSDTQIQCIQGLLQKGNGTPATATQINRPTKTILGKPVVTNLPQIVIKNVPKVPKFPTDGWKEVGVKSSKTNKQATSLSPKTSPKKPQNSFELLIEDMDEQEIDLNEEETPLHQQQVENKTDKKEPTDPQESEKVVERVDQVKRYTLLKKSLGDRDIWPKNERRTMIDALVGPMLKVGYAEAGDFLVDLLKHTNEQIQDMMITQSPSGSVKVHIPAEETQETKGEEKATEKVLSPHLQPHSILPPTSALGEEAKTEPNNNPLTQPHSLTSLEQTNSSEDHELDAKHTDQDQGTTIEEEPFTPNKDRPPEDHTPERSTFRTEAKQSNTKVPKTLRSFFSPSPLTINDDRRQ